MRSDHLTWRHTCVVLDFEEGFVRSSSPSSPSPSPSPSPVSTYWVLLVPLAELAVSCSSPLLAMLRGHMSKPWSWSWASLPIWTDFAHHVQAFSRWSMMKYEWLIVVIRNEDAGLDNVQVTRGRAATLWRGRATNILIWKLHNHRLELIFSQNLELTDHADQMPNWKCPLTSVEIVVWVPMHIIKFFDCLSCHHLPPFLMGFKFLCICLWPRHVLVSVASTGDQN